MRYPKAEAYEITPGKLVAARRAVQRQKDRFPLFPELITHQTAEERLDAIAYGRAEWWQNMRDHQAKQWRRARKSLRDLPRGPSAAITRYGKSAAIQATLSICSASFTNTKPEKSVSGM
jgi:hypothetical protein